MFQILITLALLIPVLSGCGKDKPVVNTTDAPACSSEFIQDYNAVKVSADSVQKDFDAAYGPNKPTDPDALKAAKTKAYQSSQTCKAKGAETGIVDEMPTFVLAPCAPR